MRARKRKHGEERLAAAAAVLCEDKAAVFADAQSPFGEKRPLHLEIGCGKGKFSCEMSVLHPDVNFYAMEKVSDVMVIAAERALQTADERPDNLRFIVGDAKELTEWFAPHTFSCIYKTLLAEGGVLRLKTDNVGLFDFSLEEFEAAGMEVLRMSRDLHNSPYSEGNVMTEYETNFSGQGIPICFAEVKVK